MNIGLRKSLMTFLLAAFGVQSALVYFDDAGADATLTELAVRGRRIWHEHNCQVCHQIYGFGGFLGPDLTNAAQRLTRARLDEVLTVGNAQMPAFHLSSEAIDAVEAYLHELNTTGIGVARRDVPHPASEVYAALEAHASAAPPDAAAARGMQLFRSICTACHVPLQATSLGLNTAPDLSTVVTRFDDAAVRATILQGRPMKGMPPWAHLGEAGAGDIVQFFHWLHQERDALRARLPGGASQGLPWWEYK